MVKGWLKNVAKGSGIIGWVWAHRIGVNCGSWFKQTCCPISTYVVEPFVNNSFPLAIVGGSPNIILNTLIILFFHHQIIWYSNIYM